MSDLRNIADPEGRLREVRFYQEWDDNEMDGYLWCWRTSWRGSLHEHGRDGFNSLAEAIDDCMSTNAMTITEPPTP